MVDGGMKLQEWEQINSQANQFFETLKPGSHNVSDISSDEYEDHHVSDISSDDESPPPPPPPEDDDDDDVRHSRNDNQHRNHQTTTSLNKTDKPAAVPRNEAAISATAKRLLSVMKRTAVGEPLKTQVKEVQMKKSIIGAVTTPTNKNESASKEAGARIVQDKVLEPLPDDLGLGALSPKRRKLDSGKASTERAVTDSISLDSKSIPTRNSQDSKSIPTRNSQDSKSIPTRNSREELKHKLRIKLEELKQSVRDGKTPNILSKSSIDRRRTQIQAPVSTNKSKVTKHEQPSTLTEKKLALTRTKRAPSTNKSYSLTANSKSRKSLIGQEKRQSNMLNTSTVVTKSQSLKQSSDRDKESVKASLKKDVESCKSPKLSTIKPSATKPKQPRTPDQDLAKGSSIPTASQAADGIVRDKFDTVKERIRKKVDLVAYPPANKTADTGKSRKRRKVLKGSSSTRQVKAKPPKEVVVNIEDEEFNIECIVQHRKLKHDESGVISIDLLVKWEGYDDIHNTWESWPANESLLNNIVVDEYIAKLNKWNCSELTSVEGSVITSPRSSICDTDSTKWEVDDILAKYTHLGSLYYLVRWAGEDPTTKAPWSDDWLSAASLGLDESDSKTWSCSQPSELFVWSTKGQMDTIIDIQNDILSHLDFEIDIWKVLTANLKTYPQQSRLETMTKLVPMFAKNSFLLIPGKILSNVEQKHIDALPEKLASDRPPRLFGKDNVLELWTKMVESRFRCTKQQKGGEQMMVLAEIFLDMTSSGEVATVDGCFKVLGRLKSSRLRKLFCEGRISPKKCIRELRDMVLKEEKN